MPYFGCHLSPSGGYAAMVRTAASLGGDTFQFFTRNPRGSRAKAPDLADAARAGALMKEGAFGPVVAHGAYTMNLCTQDPDARAYRPGFDGGSGPDCPAPRVLVQLPPRQPRGAGAGGGDLSDCRGPGRGFGFRARSLRFIGDHGGQGN